MQHLGARKTITIDYQLNMAISILLYFKTIAMKFHLQTIDKGPLLAKSQNRLKLSIHVRWNKMHLATLSLFIIKLI